MSRAPLRKSGASVPPSSERCAERMNRPRARSRAFRLLLAKHWIERFCSNASLRGDGLRQLGGGPRVKSLDLLLSLDPASLALLFWFTLMFDVPRYVISLVVISIFERKKLPPLRLTTSAIVAGHNEANSIRACVESINADQIIVVDDGSTDDMWKIVEQLKAEGLVHKAIRLPKRSSKITAINLALEECTGEIVFIVDADTVLEPGAIDAALPYFADPKVGGVSCDLKVENESASLTTRFQAVEYAMAISMGRQVADALDLMPNVSGACGAFRLSALRAVGGLDMEVSEDAALTMKLRNAGYEIRFAPEAVGKTRVPETLTALTIQRLRWDSGLISVWCRRCIGNISPLSPHFRLIEALVILDVIWFSIVLPLALPIYCVWLWSNVGEFAFTLLGAILIGLTALDVFMCIVARVPFRLFPYIPLYTLMQNMVMRPIRIAALVGELIFVSSRRDNYIPEQQRWRLS
jgi:poly-beta-1,6-N-acetyl-D-glucosamine synthase